MHTPIEPDMPEGQGQDSLAVEAVEAAEVAAAHLDVEEVVVVEAVVRTASRLLKNDMLT